MKALFSYSLILLSLLSCDHSEKNQSHSAKIPREVVRVKIGIEDNSITEEWRKALTTRQSRQYLDSLATVKRALTEEEKTWYQLINSRTRHWAQLRDSLNVPFGVLAIADTIQILLGYLGNDDGFTYEYQTVCFDLTALHKAYGSATDSINTDRIDRLFAHEYTHLLSKEWAMQNRLVLQNFEDSILWECMYEGLGMYRSMSAKWFPNGNNLSKISAQTLESLYPIFSARLITIHTSRQLSEHDKIRLQKNLSRGSMTQKWGALPVGVWLALEANQNDKNLQQWVNKGHHAVIPLALKYLPTESKVQFEKVFREVP